MIFRITFYICLLSFAICLSSNTSHGACNSGPAIIALGCDGTTGLEIEGASVLDVIGGTVAGEIQVNCDSCDYPNPAIDVTIVATIEAAQINVVGCYDGPDFNFPIVEGADPMPDPLGCWPDGNCIMPLPPYDPNADLAQVPGEYYIPSDGEVLEPGYYSGGIKITSQDVVFKPGIYVLDGEISNFIIAKGGLKISSGGIICAKRVMFYILGGSVDIGGIPEMELTELAPYGEPPDTDFCDPGFDYPPNYYSDGTLATYQGMLIYQDKENTSPARIIGTSDLILEGTIYLPFNHVELGGGGYSVGNQLIANSILVHTASGQGVAVDYDGRNRLPLVGDIASAQGIGIADGVVDWYDLECLTGDWLETTLLGESFLISDINQDRIVNEKDFSYQAANWCP